MVCGEQRFFGSSWVIGASLAFRASHLSDECSQLFSGPLAWNCYLETYRCYSRADHSGSGGFRRGRLVYLWLLVWSRVLARAPLLYHHECWRISQVTSP